MVATVGGLAVFKAVSDNLLSKFNKNNIAGALKNGSYIDIARTARIEPLTIIDTDLIHTEYISDVVQSLQAVFSGYVLQAISLMGTEVGGVSLVKKLAPFNPNTGSNLGKDIDWRSSLESYKHRLPTTHNHLAVSMEKDETDTKSINKMNKVEGIDDIKEAVDLSFGKMYNVTIKVGSESATVPLAIRLLVNTMQTSQLVNMFALKDKMDSSFKERFHGWKSGRLEFIKDLIFCNDLIDAHRKALLKDNTGIYNQIVNRGNKQKLAGFFNEQPSVAVASNLAIISSETASLIESRFSGKIKDLKTRNSLFENTNLMILVVVDKQWERVTFYSRGISESTTVGIKDLKSSNKGSSDNVMDFLKMYISGSSPVL